MRRSRSRAVLVKKEGSLVVVQMGCCWVLVVWSGSKGREMEVWSGMGLRAGRAGESEVWNLVWSESCASWDWRYGF